MARDNPTATDHECSICHETFESEEKLREHTKAAHADHI